MRQVVPDSPILNAVESDVPGVFVPAVNTAYVSFQFTQPDGEFAQYGLWVERDEAWDVAKLTALASAAAGGWNTPHLGADTLKEHTAKDITLIQVGARDFTTQTSASVLWATGLPLAGTGADTALPAGLAFAVTLRTGLSGRSFRGRIFFFGLGDADVSPEDKNVIVGASADGVVSAVGGLIGTINASDGAHNKVVVCSRTSSVETPAPPHARATAVLTPVIGQGYHDLFLDFQRRRAPGHNRHH